MKPFQPPIQDRQTSALIKIVAIPENWDAEAVEQAEAELLKRGVEFEDLKLRLHLASFLRSVPCYRNDNTFVMGKRKAIRNNIDFLGSYFRIR